MDHKITALERVFQLARSGDYGSGPELKKRLRAGGHSVDQITGRVLLKQLQRLIQEARV